MPEDKKEEMKLDHRTDCPSHDRVSSWYRAGAVTVHDKIMNWLCCLACDTASWSRTLKHYLSALDMKMWSNWNLRVTSHYSHPCFHFHKKKKKLDVHQATLLEKIWVVHITSLKWEQAIQLTFRQCLKQFGALLWTDAEERILKGELTPGNLETQQVQVWFAWADLNHRNNHDVTNMTLILVQYQT